MVNNYSNVNLLGQDVWAFIFSFNLSVEELGRYEQVCKAWKNSIENKKLWQSAGLEVNGFSRFIKENAESDKTVRHLLKEHLSDESQLHYRTIKKMILKIKETPLDKKQILTIKDLSSPVGNTLRELICLTSKDLLPHFTESSRSKYLTIPSKFTLTFSDAYQTEKAKNNLYREWSQNFNMTLKSICEGWQEQAEINLEVCQISPVEAFKIESRQWIQLYKDNAQGMACLKIMADVERLRYDEKREQLKICKYEDLFSGASKGYITGKREIINQLFKSVKFLFLK